MERGILWLPLLGLFSWLAWAGWHEYRKLEAYKTWAVDFERAKYDVYAVLGQVGEMLVWGRPTRRGPEETQEVSLSSVAAIALRTQANPAPQSANLPKGCAALELLLTTGEQLWIPFTDSELAARWQKVLQSLLKSLESTPHP